MEKEALIQFIKEVFDGVEQPLDMTLHVAEAHGWYDYEHDDSHRKKDFFGPWQDLPLEHIKKCSIALSFVNKEGMQYYLPAYMAWYLENFGNDEKIGSDDTLYSLDNNPDNPELAAYHKERFSLFNLQQLRACALFVKYCSEDKSRFTDLDFATNIYEAYWVKYMADSSG